MHFFAGVLSPELNWACAALSGLLLAIALPELRALWGHPKRLHLLLGSALGLALLWSIQVRVDPGVALHVLGAPTVAIVLGWRLALLAAALAELGLLALAASGGWAVPAGWLLSAALPAAVAVGIAWLARLRLPRNPFVFIFVCAFFGSGLAVAVTWLAGGVLLGAAGHSLRLGAGAPVAAFLPLVLFPEAFINGALLSMLVVYRPDWVRLYDESFYSR